jgi:amidophosphoribosyltransferase
MLSLLTHRGQDASGISWITETNKLHLKKSKTYPSKLLIPEETSLMSIGSTRYPTYGQRFSDNTETDKFAQPFKYSYPGFELILVHNGQLTNMRELSPDEEFLSDADLICKLFGENLDEFKLSVEDSVLKLMNELDGSYSVITMLKSEKKNRMIVFRDPLGIRPLVMGKLNGTYIFASESIAIEQLGGNFIRDVKAGELIIVEEINGTITLLERQLILKEPKHCMFEYVYFASQASLIENRSFYEISLKLGENLAQEIRKRKLNVDYVIPVPDSSKISAQRIAEELNIPFREALLKNRYQTKRTFIINGEIERSKALDTKYIIVQQYIKGKNVLLVDDSIVRGSTAKKLIKRLKGYGAKSIILASTCPPIIRPCYYGIDMSIDDELIAKDKSLHDIQDELKADLVIYQGIGDLYNAIGMNNLCTACVTGEYPTKNGQLIRKLLKDGKLDTNMPHYEQLIQ